MEKKDRVKRFTCKRCGMRSNMWYYFSDDLRFILFKCPKCLGQGSVKNKDFQPLDRSVKVKVISRKHLHPTVIVKQLRF